jgi:hypothetical protein
MSTIRSYAAPISVPRLRDGSGPFTRNSARPPSVARHAASQVAHFVTRIPIVPNTRQAAAKSRLSRRLVSNSAIMASGALKPESWSLGEAAHRETRWHFWTTGRGIRSRDREVVPREICRINWEQTIRLHKAPPYPDNLATRPIVHSLRDLSPWHELT